MGGTDGEIVADGTDFRNTAHLRYKADILVPCGGRPESINVTNVHQLWDAEGVPAFKYLVEGASDSSSLPQLVQSTNIWAPPAVP